MACVIIICQMGAINFEREDYIILQYYQINRQFWEAFSKLKIVNRYSAVTLIPSPEAYSGGSDRVSPLLSFAPKSKRRLDIKSTAGMIA